MVDISIDGEFVKFELNLDIYDLETVYSVAFQMSEYSYLYFHSGTSDSKIVVNLSYQESDNSKNSLMDLAKSFFNHLINYKVYKFNAGRKHLFRSMILQKSYDNPDFSSYLKQDECLTKDN